jgi:hypothetical protein
MPTNNLPFVAGSSLYIHMDATSLFLITQSNQPILLSITSTVNNIILYPQAKIAPREKGLDCGLHDPPTRLK